MGSGGKASEKMKDVWEVEDVCEFASEIIECFLRVSEDIYQEGKLMALCGENNKKVRHFWEVVFDESDRRRPLLLEVNKHVI